MASQWYVKVQGKQAGPVTSQQIKALAEQGKISPDDLVRQETSESWIPARKIKGLFGSSDPQADVPPATAAPVSAEPTETQAAPPFGIQVVSESPTARVMARCAASSSRRGRAPSNKTVVATLVVLLLLMSAVGIGVMVVPRGGSSTTPSQASEATSPSPSATDDVEDSGNVVLTADDTVDLVEKLGILAPDDDDADKKLQLEASSKETVAEKPSRTEQAKEPGGEAEPNRQAVAKSDEKEAAAADQMASEGKQEAQTMPAEEPAEAANKGPLEGVDKIAADIAALGGGEDTGLDYGGDEMSGDAEKDAPKRRNPPAKKPAN